MNNKIKGLFYKIDEKEVLQLVSELEKMEYLLEFKTVDTLNLVKSEIMNSSWDVLVLENEKQERSIEEILDFINDVKSNISILVVSEVISSDLVQTVFKHGKNDIVPRNDKCQVCFALIRNFEKTNTRNQADFTRKELLRTQKTQHEHESFLNQVIESTTNPIFYKGLEGRYLGCNTAFANFLGMSKDEIIGKTVFDVSHSKLAQKYFEMDQEFFKNPITQHYEYQAIDAKGNVMDVIFYKTAINDDEGNVVGLLGHMFDITDRKKLEREIYQEKELAQNIVDSTDQLIVTLDMEGNISSLNKKACDVLQCDKNDVIGKNWFQTFIPGDDIEKIQKIFFDIIENKADIDVKVEGKVRTMLNEEKVILWTNKIIWNKKNEKIGTLSLGTEITNKDKLEFELKESEYRYKTLVENMHEGIGIVDLDENVVFCNNSFNKIFGLEDDSMVGKDFKEFVDNDSLELINDETDKRRKNEKSQYKINIKRNDGKKRIINISSVPWKDVNNEIKGAISLITDITAQYFATKRLKQKVKIEQSIINISSQFISSENFHSKLDAALNELQNIIEAERYAVFMVHNNNLKLISEQFSGKPQGNGVDFGGLSFENMKYGLNMLNSLDFVFFDDVSKLPEEANDEKEFLKEHNIFNLLSIPFYSGSELMGLLSIANIYDVNDWTIEDLSSLRTITEIIGHAYSRYKAEEKVKQLNQDLVTKNKELEQVVYVTSHDIRSPVVNILGFSDEMIKALNKLADRVFDKANTIQNKEDVEYLINKDIPHILSFIKVSGQKIDKLLLALLKLSRLGRAAINKVNVDMNKMFEVVLNTYEYKIKQDNILIEKDNLPACYTDEVAINQVFSNLIDNAIKYRSHDREAVIKIKGWEQDDKVHYSIEDNGIGISEAELDKIFDVFYRIDPENQEGEGIGLALIKKTIERLDGNISVGSTEGKGTKFYISLEKTKE